MKKLISMALAAGMAVSLAACGGAASSSAPAADSAAASTTEAAADSDLAYIQGKGKMTIGYTVYEPMNYTDADGNFTGFDTELATAVCEKLGVEPDFVEINWDTKIVELEAKSIDCIWNGMTLTDEIQANAACTKAYAKNAQVVVMKSDADYSSTADLVGKTVVAEAGSAGESAIQDDESLSQADYVSKSVQTDCLMEVAAGTADAAVLSFYNAGILTGVDDWGTFAPDKTLTRAETAAMVARVARPELRENFSPADYAMFTAAYLKPADVLFTNGVTAGQYLPYVQTLIDGLEADCAAQGMEFNWFNTVDGVIFLDYVEDTALAHFGVTAKDGTQLYKDFDMQVYYSRYLDQKG